MIAESSLHGATADAKKCEFPGSSVGCLKCAPCVAIMARRIARAAPHTDLIALQSRRKCRICDRIERYCQTDGQGRGRHVFAPRLTCESCVHMGGRYWGSDDLPIHYCGKSVDRRAANFRSCGDGAEDFMREFRTFYDASQHYSAEDCAFFEAKPLAASVDTLPKGGDGEAGSVRSKGSAVARDSATDAPNTSEGPSS